MSSVARIAGKKKPRQRPGLREGLRRSIDEEVSADRARTDRALPGKFRDFRLNRRIS